MYITLRLKKNEDKIPDTNLATTASLKAKMNKVKGQIPSVTRLPTTAVLATVENKIPNVSDLVKKA